MKLQRVVGSTCAKTTLSPEGFAGVALLGVVVACFSLTASPLAAGAPTAQREEYAESAQNLTETTRSTVAKD